MINERVPVVKNNRTRFLYSHTSKLVSLKKKKKEKKNRPRGARAGHFCVFYDMET